MGGWEGRFFIILTSILIVVGNLKEVFIINVFVILGAFILVSLENLIMIYLGLEMQNLGIFGGRAGSDFLSHELLSLVIVYKYVQ